MFVKRIMLLRPLSYQCRSSPEAVKELAFKGCPPFVANHCFHMIKKVVTELTKQYYERRTNENTRPLFVLCECSYIGAAVLWQWRCNFIKVLIEVMAPRPFLLFAISYVRMEGFRFINAFLNNHSNIFESYNDRFTFLAKNIKKKQRRKTCHVWNMGPCVRWRNLR